MREEIKTQDIRVGNPRHVIPQLILTPVLVPQWIFTTNRGGTTLGPHGQRPCLHHRNSYISNCLKKAPHTAEEPSNVHYLAHSCLAVERNQKDQIKQQSPSVWHTPPATLGSADLFTLHCHTNAAMKMSTVTRGTRKCRNSTNKPPVIRAGKKSSIK